MRGRDGMRREVTSEGDVAAPSYVREGKGGRDTFLQWAVTQNRAGRAREKLSRS